MTRISEGGEAARPTRPNVSSASQFGAVTITNPTTQPQKGSIMHNPATKAPPMPTCSTGAARDALASKIQTHLVPFELIAFAAIGLNYGAEKYAPRNFEQGLPLSAHLNSIDRHTRALMAGELVDSESGLLHVHLLASSIAMLAHNWHNGVCENDIPPKTSPNAAAVSDVARAAVYYLQDGLANLRNTRDGR